MNSTNRPSLVGLLFAAGAVLLVHTPASAGVNIVPNWVQGVEIDVGRRKAEGQMGVQNFRDARQSIGCIMMPGGDGYCVANNNVANLSCYVPAGADGMLGLERLTPMTRLRFRVDDQGNCVDVHTDTNSAQHFPEAGYHLLQHEAVVDLVNRTASAGLGAVRNSSDTMQLAYCVLFESNYLLMAGCYVRDRTGKQLSCATERIGMVDAVRSIGPLSLINITSDTSGHCTNLTVTNWSYAEQPR